MQTLQLSRKEARKFCANLAETTMQAVAFDKNTPRYLRKMVQKNLALYVLMKPKKGNT